MADTLFVIIGVANIVACVVACVVANIVESSPLPPVIIQVVQEPRQGTGCMPLIVGIFLACVVLRLLAGP